MNIFERVDTKILSFFTKISHKFQILTGRTNFFLAKCCLFLVSFSVVISLLDFFIPLLNKKSSLVTTFLGIVWIRWISQDLNKTKEAEDMLGEEQAKHIFNLGLDWIGRLLFIFLFLVLDLSPLLKGITKPKTHWVFEVADYIFIPLIVTTAYFLAVTPLPPGRSKVHQWLESFGRVLKPVPVRSRN